MPSNRKEWFVRQHLEGDWTAWRKCFADGAVQEFALKDGECLYRAKSMSALRRNEYQLYRCVDGVVSEVEL
tara:strand:- start:998 stop:1210 length:213 start_codon:yes stop_codon:yes gene_type:complete